MTAYILFKKNGDRTKKRTWCQPLFPAFPFSFAAPIGGCAKRSRFNATIIPWPPESAQTYFGPMKSVAILGASANRTKFGNKAVRAFVQKGYQVFPVNPVEKEIEGLSVYRTIEDIPTRPSIVSVYLGPPTLLKLLPAIASKGCDELWLNPGTESTEVLAEAERLGLSVVSHCSIIAIGVSPSVL
jgi:predicted CoA-binding protein